MARKCYADFIWYRCNSRTQVYLKITQTVASSVTRANTNILLHD
jgi:hypothetical protein